MVPVTITEKIFDFLQFYIMIEYSVFVIYFDGFFVIGYWA